ncbi:MAG: citrate lyase subunit alpha [Eubacteriales bacterium]|nr:citrate lyase subunit alpha [Eubacteriales bacterium]
MNKIVKSLEEALKLAGIKNGQTISFHHHLRNGDYVLNMTMDIIEKMGVNNLTVNASSIFDIQAETISNCINKKIITKLQCNYMSKQLGRKIVDGILECPVEFRTHGGRASDMQKGIIPVDIAIIASPTSDNMGNISGKYGISACGSLGYAFADATYAKKVIVVTDNLVPYPLTDYSIPEIYIDYVVKVDSIGDPSGIVSGTTQITRDPVGLIMAKTAANVIKGSGLLKDGFSFQTGAGGASLAAAKYLKEIMLKEKIQGSFGLGGITSYMVDMLKCGLFKTLFDVQCFDLGAVESIRLDPRHKEVSAMHYAGPYSKSAIVDSLDVVILGATEIDTNFNVNVHTDSNGCIIGGSGGHSDTAKGAKMSMIIAPLVRARLPIVSDEVACISTKGEDIDVLITQYGVAINKKNKELKEKLLDSNINIVDIQDLKKKAEEICGTPKPYKSSGRVVAKVFGRDGDVISTINALK